MHILYTDSHLIAGYMEFIFERLRHKNPDGSLQIMYTIHGKVLSIVNPSLETKGIFSNGKVGKTWKRSSLTIWMATRARVLCVSVMAPLITFN